MQMTMRWYGSQYDTVTLQQIRQTAYVKGVISTLRSEERRVGKECRSRG